MPPKQVAPLVDTRPPLARSAGLEEPACGGACARTDIAEEHRRSRGPEVGEHAREVVLHRVEHGRSKEVCGREEHLERLARALAQELHGGMDIAEHMAVVRAEAERAAVGAQRGRDFVEEACEARVPRAHPGAWVVSEGLVRQGSAPGDDPRRWRVEVDDPRARERVAVDERGEDPHRSFRRHRDLLAAGGLRADHPRKRPRVVQQVDGTAHQRPS